MRRLVLVAAVMFVPAAGQAERISTTDPGTPAQPATPTGPRIVVETPVEQFTPHAEISHTLYLERCIGGCRVTKSTTNDASNMESTIPMSAGEHTIAEFINNDGQSGAAADADWNALVQCLREVYSPYALDVTDTKPPPGEPAHVAIIAGIPQSIGFGNDILGVAPLASNCSAQDNVISFSFANAHPPQDDRILDLCWTAAQESAHAFGLDHSFVFTDGRSACNDPMTYQVDCGGQRFFRNQQAKCGEFAERPCRCGATQNSHQKLLDVFGEGTPITGSPTSVVTTPLNGGMLGAVVVAEAGSKRGIARLELRLNGFPWAEQKGALFGPNGQETPAAYGILVPPNVPDSIIDVQVRAYDDLGTFTDSIPITVTKGAPCTSAETCADRQKCENGRCLWDPPVGEIGDDCEYPQYCKSNICTGTADHQICTQACVPGEIECPGGLACIASGEGTGVCFFEDSGCCSVGGGGGEPWPYLAGSTLILATLLRRRRASA